MSYQLLSKTEPKAKKDYKCIWCPEGISKGVKHVHEVSTYSGEFQNHRWHPECYSAATKYFLESGEEEFQPRAFKRGNDEEL